MADGNYSARKRKGFFLSRDCCRYLVEIAFREGISESAVLELAVRRYYEEMYGERPWTRDPNEPKWD